MTKKTVANKRPRGSSSTEYDKTRFVSAEVEARFNNSVTRWSGLKERGFDINMENSRMEYFQRVIQSRGWQRLFCKHPKAATMIVVREFHANAEENTSTQVVFVKVKQVRYDADTINQLFCLQYTLVGPDELDVLIKLANMEKVSNEIYGGGTKWNIVRNEHAQFPSKDLY